MEPMLSIACSRWLCSSLVSPVSLPESTIYPGVGNGLRAFGLKLHIARSRQTAPGSTPVSILSFEKASLP